MEVSRRKEKIEGSRFNTRYKEIKTKGILKYILEGKKRRGEWIRVLARVRCGSEEVANKYWLGGERIGCRLCELGRYAEACAKGMRGYVEMGGRYCEIIGGGGILLDKGVDRTKE